MTKAAGILFTMAIEFRNVTLGNLRGFSATVPSGGIIGVVGENGSGASELLLAASGTKPVDSGEIIRDEDPLVVFPEVLALQDPLGKAQTQIEVSHAKRSGQNAFIGTHDELFLRTIADEIWWIHQGRVEAKGDPHEVLSKYQTHICQRIRALGAGAIQNLRPQMRRGDGRARIVEIQTLGGSGNPTMVLQSGEAVSVRIVVRFESDVEDPVIGIMIRTRIGFEVYGTNTELEQFRIAPQRAGDAVEVRFSFPCDLCPQEYTITAASHDPDGVWHDWLEDAIAFLVADKRYTAGVANLHASVSVQQAALTSNRV